LIWPGRQPCHPDRVRQQTARRCRAAAQAFSLPNVTVVTSALTTEVQGDGRRSPRWSTRTATDEVVKLDLEGIFVQIGLLPNSDWLKGSVELSPRGEIIVDARGETSLPGVSSLPATCTTAPYKQIVIAVGEGAKASLSAFDHLIRILSGKNSAPRDAVATA
jgi:NADH-dependent peroxiredoxin subunit F